MWQTSRPWAHLDATADDIPVCVFVAGKTLCRPQYRTPHSCTEAKVALTSLEDCQQATGQQIGVQLGT